MSPLTSNDLKGMRDKIHNQREEKKLQENVRRQMEARIELENQQYQKIQNMLDAKKLEVERKHKAKIEALEQQISMTLKIEEQNEMAYQKQRLELTKNTRKILEQQEKDLRESLKRLEDHFDKIEDNFNIIVRACNPDLSQTVELYKKHFNSLKSQKIANSASLDANKNACIKAEELCHSLHKICRDYEVQAEALRAQKEADDIEAAQIAAKQAALALPQPTMVAQHPPETAPQQTQVVQTPDHLGRYYSELMELLNVKQSATRQLTETQELQVIRFALKVAVNNPINILNEQNKTTLIEGFQKLFNLLTGQRITTTKGAVSITDHIEASDWTKLRIAEKLIVSYMLNNLTFLKYFSLFQDACDKKEATVFYVAALTIALWQKFPDFGQIFIAKLIKECPLLLPYKPRQLSGQNDEDFLSSWGYRFSNGRFEEYAVYQKRTSNYATLIAAIWTSFPRRDENSPHPCGIDNAWKFIANVLNSQPDPMYLHLIDKVLEITGSTLHQIYGREFTKLVIILRDQYLPLVERKVDDKMKGAFDRLRGLTIGKFFTENRFLQPRGSLIPNYW